MSADWPVYAAKMVTWGGAKNESKVESGGFQAVSSGLSGLPERHEIVRLGFSELPKSSRSNLFLTFQGVTVWMLDDRRLLSRWMCIPDDRCVCAVSHDTWRLT